MEPTTVPRGCPSSISRVTRVSTARDCISSSCCWPCTVTVAATWTNRYQHHGSTMITLTDAWYVFLRPLITPTVACFSHRTSLRPLTNSYFPSATPHTRRSR
ncbi:hypothetical protein L798_07603 [Zootermopsis nevadensis]|uniref:Uncharacterized protein n=1 Tax=Zootermopsis nevadensis TaxID=136037 RepID=A0A067RK24_ZOONE|nr:hypothetical protein L798_07603 [Zootermopsis nevadensis]